VQLSGSTERVQSAPPPKSFRRGVDGEGRPILRPRDDNASGRLEETGGCKEGNNLAPGLSYAVRSDSLRDNSLFNASS